MKRKTRAWKREQIETIGSSTAPMILGRSRFGTPMQVYRLMRGEVQPADIDSSPDVRRGHLLEPIGRYLVQEATGKRVRKHPQDQFVYHPDMPFAHALPDAWMEQVPVQIKFPRPARFQRLRMEGLDDEYIVSAHHEMAVTKQQRMYFAVCCCVTMDVLLVPIERDEQFTAEMLLAEQEFYDHVQRGLPPPEDSMPIIEVPEIEGEMRYFASEEANRAAQAFLEAREIVLEAAELKDEATSRLKNLTHDASGFEIRNQDGSPLLRCYNKIYPGRTTFDHKAAVAANPELKKFYKEGPPYHTFRGFDLRKGAH